MRAPLRNVAVVEDPLAAEALIMLPTEDVLVHVDVLVDDAIAAGEVTVPARAGSDPACSDAELLTIVLVRRSCSPAAAPVRGQRPPAHPMAVGRLEAAARRARAGRPVDDCAQVDTTALPVMHPSRVPGRDGWVDPDELGRPFQPRRRTGRVVARHGSNTSGVC